MKPDTEYITVRQYATAANISAQAVYQRLDKDLKPFVKLIKGRKMLSIEVLQLLGVSDAPITCQEQPKEVDKQLTSEENAEIERLQQEIQDLKQQLLDKQERIKELELDKHELELDKKLTSGLLEQLQSQLTELKADKAKLNDRLDKAETNISNLTAALAAAQALHGMDKQQAAIELNAGDQEEPEQKRSLFSKLFRKRSE